MYMYIQEGYRIHMYTHPLSLVKEIPLVHKRIEAN